MHTVTVLNQDSRRKDYLPVYLFIDCATSFKHYNNYYFLNNLKSAFAAHYEEEGKNTKRKKTFHCHYCNTFFRYKGSFNKHIRYCSGRPGFIYSFQDEDIECYENYLKHKKDFLFTVVGDLETTTGYISEIKGGSMFATSYCLMFSFHLKLEMTPVTRLRGFGQNENEFKHVTIPENFFSYIDRDDYRCFIDQCDEVLKKEKNRPCLGSA